MWAPVVPGSPCMWYPGRTVVAEVRTSRDPGVLYVGGALVVGAQTVAGWDAL